MQNAFGEPQTILVIGGTSDIGVAIARKLAGPTARHVVLACRDASKGEERARSLRRDGLTVDVVNFEGGSPDTHSRVVDEAVALVGDIDVAVLAFGQLSDHAITCADPVAAAALCDINVSGSISALIAVGERMRSQGHGVIVVLSSVAGERVRKANAVYGATKAALDGAAQGLGDRWASDGVHVMVVRPGFVHSAMTEGLAAVPFATTPDHVADVVMKGLRARRRVVWAPPMLRPIFALLRHVPGPIWRRLPLG